MKGTRQWVCETAHSRLAVDAGLCVHVCVCVFKMPHDWTTSLTASFPILFSFLFIYLHASSLPAYFLLTLVSFPLHVASSFHWRSVFTVSLLFICLPSLTFP